MRRTLSVFATLATLASASAAFAGAGWPLPSRLPNAGKCSCGHCKCGKTCKCKGRGAKAGCAMHGKKGCPMGGHHGHRGHGAHHGMHHGTMGGTPATSGALADDLRVAVVDGEPVTYGEIRARTGMKLAQTESKYLRKRRELETRALRGIITDRLLAAEARRRKTTVDALVASEIDSRVSEPTEADLKSTYEKFKSRIPAGYDEVKPQLVAFIKQGARRERKFAFLAELRRRAGVREMLPEQKLPEIVIPEDGAPALGPSDAPIKVVVFSDFECPYCAKVVPTIHALKKKYAGRIRIAFRDFPLSFHENAQRAAEAALCAHDQGKFWAFHDQLFANQDKLGDKDLAEHAKTLGLDGAAFGKCVKDGRHRERVQRNQKAGEDVGVNGTPAIFINGTLLSGAQPLDAMVEVVESFLKSGAN